MNTTHACHRILVAILLFSADFNEEGITALAQRVKKVLPASPPVSLIPLPRAEIENDEFSSDVDDYVLSPLDEYSCDVEDAAHFKAAKAMKNQGAARTSGTASRAQRSKAAFVAGRKQAVAVKRATDRSSTQATRVMRLSKESHLCVGLGSPVRVGGVPQSPRPSPVVTRVEGVNVNTAPIAPANMLDIQDDWESLAQGEWIAKQRAIAHGVLDFEAAIISDKDSSAVFGIPLDENMFAVLDTEDCAHSSLFPKLPLRVLVALHQREQEIPNQHKGVIPC